VPEVIEEGHDGLLVPFGDETSLAAAIEAILGDPDRCHAMGEQGRAKVKAHYTWDRVYRKLLAAYEELVASSHPATGDGGS
jgi:glycosyltransferase involved in cell wall biosynthesis